MKNFDQIKGQLKELAEIVNSFKSEAVQLRIVDLVFGAGSDEEESLEPLTRRQEPALAKPRRKRRIRKGSSSQEESAPNGETRRAARSTGRGAKATLARLVESGFFKKPQTIRALVDHCEVNLASKYKQSEFSGALARYVRDGKLRRTKNSDNQYEYTES